MRVERVIARGAPATLLEAGEEPLAGVGLGVVDSEARRRGVAAAACAGAAGQQGR